MSYGMQLLLGLIAGGTIYLGLLAGRVPARNAVVRSSMAMLAAGILVYLLVEIVGSAAGQAGGAWTAAVRGYATHGRAFVLTVLLLGGFAFGLVGLTALQERLGRFWRARAARQGEDPDRAVGPAQLAWSIATGIGLHNLSEGLAIGASAASGRTALATGLVVGFALHNATEGFGILGPLVGAQERVRWGTLGLLGLLGGGPTFLGVLVGGTFTSSYLDVLVLATAGGALLYVVAQLLGTVKRTVAASAQTAVMAMLAVGFAVGWGTEVTASVATAAPAAATGAAAASCTGAVMEADGDMIGGTCAGSTSTASDTQPALSAAAAAAQQRTASDLMQEKALQPIVRDGVADYTLTASSFPWQIYPGRVVTAWGYNRSVPGPLLRWHVGEKVAVTLVNRLPQATSLHWHGLAVPEAQDGDPMVSGDVAPGASRTYAFTVTQQMLGTHWFHSHVNSDYQVDAGLHGALIVDPAPHTRVATQPRADVDALVTLSAFKVAGSGEENAFAIDGKAYPLAPELTVRKGQRVRLRLINDSAEQTHVMHLHGYTWTQVAADGNPITQPVGSNNLTLGPGETADMLIVADNLGTWMLQCHVMDHATNPSPKGDGSATQMAEMGGLITYLHVQ